MSVTVHNHNWFLDSLNRTNEQKTDRIDVSDMKRGSSIALLSSVGVIDVIW